MSQFVKIVFSSTMIVHTVYRFNERHQSLPNALLCVCPFLCHNFSAQYNDYAVLVHSDRTLSDYCRA